MNRVEHVGSFVRPEALLNAARARKAGSIDDTEFRKVQDAAIHDIVRFQESLGLPTITDGGIRRR
jgi:5-methyltetrahydropteroyltriglutamate--homocysteine methyltransferase